MKVKFYCDSGANIHSRRESVLDTVDDLGLLEGEWESMSESEKDQEVRNWMYDRLEFGWVEL